MIKKEEPLVTIGLTTYQRTNEFKRALKSILSQTYKNLEIIISENYSPGYEKKSKIIKEYLKKDKRISYFQHKPDRGPRFNAKFVLARANGKYFIFAADDDYWAPRCIAELVKKLESNPTAIVALSALKNFDLQGHRQIIRFNGPNQPNPKNIFDNFWKAIHFPQTKFIYFVCGLFRTKITQEVFLQVTNTYAADRIFLILLSLVAPVVYVDKVLFFRQIQGIDNTNEVKNFFWWGEVLAISKLVNTILFSSNICWYRKLYLPLAVVILFFRLLMLILIKLISLVLRAILFILKRLEKWQIFLANRYS